MTGGRWTVVAAAALLVSVPAVAEALYARGGDASVKATVSASAGISFAAKSGEVRITDDGTTVTFSVPVATLKTGIGMRDTHLRDHLEEPKFHDVAVAIAKADVKLPPAGGALDGTVHASVTMHGVKHDEQVPYSIHAMAGGYRVQVEKLVVHLSDYGVQPPSFAGVTVKNDVVIAADVPLSGG